MKRAVAGWLASLCLLSGTAWAGGGPHNTLVIVNDNSPESQELGQYYQDLRGLPERHLVHVRTATNYSATLATFTNEVVQPVLDYLATAGLSNQIDRLVLTRGLPYRITQGTYNGSSAVLFYGFKADGPPCSLTNAARSDYYASETAFTRAGAPSSNRYYLGTVLTGLTMDESRRALDRARASDLTAPTGRVALLHTTDYPRTIRWDQYDDALFLGRFLPGGPAGEAINSDGLSAASNLVGYLTGTTLEPHLATLGFAPGALADHLTSFGGYLLDPASLQMSILHWLAAGAAGSYGTVVEPCNYPQKFPAARLHFWYERGFSLAESYALALHSPYMGVIVGDPLAAPYAIPPQAVVSGLVAGAVVTADVALAISATSTGPAGRVSRLDVLVDGVFAATAAQRPPTPGNTVTVTLASSTRAYTVKADDTLEEVAAGLATRINAAPPIPYTATAYGDRVQVVQDGLGTSGAWIQVSASSGAGTAAVCTVFARSVFTNFLESVAQARKGLQLAGVPVSGDVVRVEIARLDGVVVTNQAVAGPADTRLTLLGALAAAVNAEPQLAGSIGCTSDWLRAADASTAELWLVARTNGWPGYNLEVTYSILTNLGSTLNTAHAFTDNFNDNADALAARANLFLTEGETNLQAPWTLAVTNLPDGPHELEVVAYEGSAVRVQGGVRIPFVVDRHDLVCVITNLASGRHILRGGVVTAEVSAVSPGAVTQVLLYVEGKLFAATSAPPYRFIWPTTNYGAGVVGLQALAQDGDGRATLSDPVALQLYTDGDGDGMSDQWEYRALGSATNGAAGDDPDDDGQSNLAEFLADTDPRDSASRHEVQTVRLADGLALDIPVTTTRAFQVEYSDTDLSSPAWTAALQSLPSATGVVTWLDAPTNAPAAPNGFRLYRVRADLP